MNISSHPPAPAVTPVPVPAFSVKIRGPVAVAHAVRARRAAAATAESSRVTQSATDLTIARATRALAPPPPTPKAAAPALRNVAPEDRAEPWTSGVQTEHYAGLDVLRHLASGRPTPILDAAERHQGHSDAVAGRKPNDIQRKSEHYMAGFEAGAKAIGKTVEALLNITPAGAPAGPVVKQPSCLRDSTLRQQGHSDALAGRKPSEYLSKQEWYMDGYNKGLREKARPSKRWSDE